MFTITRSDSSKEHKTEDFVTFNLGIQENHKPLIIGFSIKPGETDKNQGIEVDVYRASEECELNARNRIKYGTEEETPFTYLSHYSTKNQTMEITFQISDTTATTISIFHTNAYLLSDIFSKETPISNPSHIMDEPTGGWPTFDNINDEMKPKPIKANKSRNKKTTPKYERSEPVPTKDKPVKDKPIRDKPVRDKPVKDKPIKSKVKAEELVKEKPVNAKQVMEKPVKEQQVKEKPVKEKLVKDKPVKEAREKPVKKIREKPVKEKQNKEKRVEDDKPKKVKPVKPIKDKALRLSKD